MATALFFQPAGRDVAVVIDASEVMAESEAQETPRGGSVRPV
jgi:hypothetical protein